MFLCLNRCYFNIRKNFVLYITKIQYKYSIVYLLPESEQDFKHPLPLRELV